jgi:hypothetical protein
VPAAQPAGQWPPHPHGFGHAAPQSQPTQGYHFPPPEPDPGYGYAPQPSIAPQPQWAQPTDPRAYELSYQAYSGDDPSPFAQATPHQQQAYGEQDADYGDEFFDDEEPRRGRRWILIAAALVGAIGVGGALAYTYRSLVVPHSGRVPVVKADPTIKVKPSVAAERGLPSRPAEPVPPQRTAEAEPAQEEPPGESANLGPRVVRPIPINPGGVAAPPEASPPVSAVPGISIYRPPQMPQPQQPPTAAPSPAPATASAQPPPRPAPPSTRAPPQPPPGRVVIGTRPAPSETDDDPSEAAQPSKRSPVQTAALAPKIPLAKPSGGLGYVAVLSSKKSRMDALTEYADLREKYPEVLSEDKTPDVQEADLSARGLGTMYRLVVGPPGSHNAASGVCAQLKTAGYIGCWVKEY